jgi:hypothetical protein
LLNAIGASLAIHKKIAYRSDDDSDFDSV